MDYRLLGSRIEYIQAAKRLEEIAHAPSGTPEGQERKELINLFRKFEQEIHQKRKSSIRRGNHLIRGQRL